MEAINECKADVRGDKNKPKISAEFYENCDEIPDPSELNPGDRNLMIFDDCILERQSKAEAYYTRGKHNNCHSFYISQNYFLLPRETTRQKSNFIILLPQDDRNLVIFTKTIVPISPLTNSNDFVNNTGSSKITLLY